MSINDTVLLVTSYGIGKGPEELQMILLGKYLQLLGQCADLPPIICFYTEGVRVVIEGSPVLEQLINLEKRGVRLIVCSTCINYFGLENKVRVGIVGSMTDILEAQFHAGKVITL